MSDTPETREQSDIQSTSGVEVSEEQEITTNETQRELGSTQVQIETQHGTQQLKQDIDKSTFSSYMSGHGTPLESQSQEIQNITQQILWPREEVELTKEQRKYKDIKAELNDAIKNKNRGKIISAVRKLIKTFLGKFKRKINIGSDVNYTPNKDDREYVINAIEATLDPEKRSKLTYVLGKIKDEETKENLKEKGVDNPTQFQLFLQNCKPGQLILTNAESTGAKRHATFSKATQIVSGSRRCHAAVISDIKEENGIIVDATLVQATGSGIEEISLKNYFKENYKNSDLLLGTFQPPEKGDYVVQSCRNYVGGKYSQKNLVADAILDNLNKNKIKKQEKNKYCSELVFTGMQEAGLELPDPHTTPADLLSTSAIIPEYCCYCDNFK